MEIYGLLRRNRCSMKKFFFSQSRADTNIKIRKCIVDPSDNKSEIASAPIYISDESLVKLRGYLEITGEYWLYRRLLAIAVNK